MVVYVWKFKSFLYESDQVLNEYLSFILLTSKYFKIKIQNVYPKFISLTYIKNSF